MGHGTSPTPRRRAGRLLAAATLAAATLAGGAGAARAATFQVVHDFADGPVCSDTCYNPGTPKLAADPYGAVYGAYPAGGAKGKGTVWKLEPPVTRGGTWKFSVLRKRRLSDT